MIFLPEEKNIEKLWYKSEVEDLKAYASEQGYSENQTKTFVANSILALIKESYKGAVSGKEIDKLAREKLEGLDLNL